MNIAICEDEQIYVIGLKNAIHAWSLQQPDVNISISVYASAEDLLDDWERGRLFDALFLDIEFKYMSGFDLAKEIRKTDQNIPIIFVTNSDNYLVQGYEVSALRYVKKPIDQRDIGSCLDYCYRFHLSMEKDGFVVQRKGFSIRIAYRDVLYIMSGIHNVTIYVTNGQSYLVPIHTSFETYVRAFPEHSFVRCHRGYLVNMAHIERFTSNEVTLIDGTRIPIGRNYKEGALSAFQVFFMNEVKL